MPEIWLSNQAATSTQREQVANAIDDMERAVASETPRLVQVANADGALLATAAAMLHRALELLAAARSADRVESNRPAVELTVRSTFEVTCRGRFLIVSPDAQEEFTAMVIDFWRSEKAITDKIGRAIVPLPDYLAALVDQRKRKPRNLWEICEALDDADRRMITDPYSARASYTTLYQWLSNAAAHGGLAALRRFTRVEHGVLHILDHPDPLTTHWPIPVIAAHVGELAAVVFEAFGLDADAIRRTGVVLPRR